MARAKTNFACRECGVRCPRWMGRCSECGAWHSIEEAPLPSQAGRSANDSTLACDDGTITPITEISVESAPRQPFGFEEIDRVFGGGLVAGSVTLFAGEPGIGKSTLVLELAARMARNGGRVLYVSGEESSSQIRSRAERIGALEERLLLMATSDLDLVLAPAKSMDLKLLVIDSIQTARLERAETSAGSVVQVRACGLEICRWARMTGTPVLIIGHVTKDGQVAGPRHLEHLVDCVLSFEGERSRETRWVRGLKNRFGATDEIALLKMTATGLEEIEDAASHFALDSPRAMPGTIATTVLEGSRALLVDVQALVARQAWGGGRVRATGIDANRVSMLAAVLSNRFPGLLPQGDLFASVVGGLRISDPASDLALILAMASAAQGKAPPDLMMATGEVGLSGEIRPVSRIDSRVAVAKKRGFKSLIGPSSQNPGTDVEWIGVDTIEDALKRLDLARYARDEFSVDANAE